MSTRTNDDVTSRLLEQSGTSKVESDAVRVVSGAEDAHESQFSQDKNTVASPIHKLVWEGPENVSLFRPPFSWSSDVPEEDSIVALVKVNNEAGTTFGADGRVSESLLRDLGRVGYWGLLIDEEYGGNRVSYPQFMRLLTTVSAKADSNVAGLGSISMCIGATNPLMRYGTDEQKRLFLPRLAKGEVLSGFALTERGAGSDLGAIKTTGIIDGDTLYVTGEKIFISNSYYGRVIALVLLVDGVPNVAIVELPESDTDTFSLTSYGLYPLRHLHNHGLVFRNHPVPVANLIPNPTGGGLQIAYNGLNLGRIGVLANSAGIMRYLLQVMLPWVNYRETYGRPIGTRELVKRRIAEVASYIVQADAWRDWGADLLESGYRAEMECLLAKVFASESLFASAMLALRTQGGRSFLEGNPVGDNFFDILAPLIYEGENQMLGLALVKTLTKDFSRKNFGPVIEQFDRNGINLAELIKGDPGQIRRLLSSLPAVAKSSVPFLRALTGYELRQFSTLALDGASHIPAVNKLLLKDFPVDRSLAGHVNFALSRYQRLALSIARDIAYFNVRLPERQALMQDLYASEVLKLTTILISCSHATLSGDEATILAADVGARRIRADLTGGSLYAGSYVRRTARLSKLVKEGKFRQLDGARGAEILMPYK
ncbi:acyl-CoA dehydrogenase [bacterium]|nr:acyl-CoA dehydrogenase [bacterium]